MYYYGNFKNGENHGKIKVFIKNTQIYDGEFDRKLIANEENLILFDGLFYSQEYKNNKAEGRSFYITKIIQ